MKRVEILLRGRGMRLVVTENDTPYDDNMGYTEVAIIDRYGEQQQRLILTPEAESALRDALIALETTDIEVERVLH